MKPVRVLYDLGHNVGDVIAPVILGHFGYQVEYAEPHERDKLIMCNSLLECVKPGDVVIGAGSNKPGSTVDGTGVRFLSIRGPLSRGMIKNVDVPQLYGCPSLLLPLIYKPSVEITKDIGVIAHCADKSTIKSTIDIEADWRAIVHSMLGCTRIISSSLHGVIIAEAYGIPAVWAVGSANIDGREFKFQDYFLGTGRQEQKPFTDLPPIPDLKERQDRLVSVIAGFGG